MVTNASYRVTCPVAAMPTSVSSVSGNGYVCVRRRINTYVKQMCLFSFPSYYLIISYRRYQLRFSIQ